MASNENDKPTDAEPEMYGPPAPEPSVPAVAIPLRWVRVSHHTPDHISTRYPYAGYGSNLSLEQMARRCPGSDIIGQGILRNARLVFAYHLGIVEDESSTVLTGVFRLTAADVAALDRHEALGRAYERFLVTVEVNGEAVRCFTYVKRDNEPEQPSDRYYNICLQGFTDWAFDTRRLRHARDFARKNEKPRKYGRGYSGYETGSGWDWRDYYESRKGSFWNPGSQDRRNHGRLQTPNVPTVDGSSGTATGQGKVSLVTGRDRSHRNGRQDNVSGRPVSPSKEAGDGGPPTNGNGKATGRANAQYKAGDTFRNPRSGELWVMGKNRVWLRQSETPDTKE